MDKTIEGEDPNNSVDVAGAEKANFTCLELDECDDGKVDIQMPEKAAPSRRLGKSEVMKYATDPSWVKLRMSLFVLFWVGCVALLVAAVVITVVTPKCPSDPKLE